jgi:hypothetical protein
MFRSRSFRFSPCPMTHDTPATNPPLSSTLPAWLGLAAVSLVSLAPLLLERLPATFVPPHQVWMLAVGSKATVLLVMIAVLALRARLDRTTEQHAALLTLTFGGLAVVLTACHWFMVDSRVIHAAEGDFPIERWQRELYLDILNHAQDADGQYRVPHQYRALPYGFTRTLEWLTGEWRFACLAYRWFFNFWFIWACYRFARLYHGAGRALVTLIPLLVLYPLSIQYYWGQLTDPLSHSLFVLAMIYVLQDRWPLVAAALALGVLAKETAVVLVPVYWACHWRQGWAALAKTAVLGAACVAAFLAARVPLGWRLGYGNINGTTGLMIGTNLGIGHPLYYGVAPTYMNYLHPLLFVGVFIPFIALQWRQIDRRLRVMFVTLTPLVLFANLCFGWMYESRNYVPLLPLLATMVLQGARPRRALALDSPPPKERLTV